MTPLIVCDSRGMLVGILATQGLGWPEGDGFAAYCSATEWDNDFLGNYPKWVC